MPHRHSLTVTLIILAALLTTLGYAAGDKPAAKDEPALPKVERDFNKITLLDDESARKTFAAMIPPESISRIILLTDHGLDRGGGNAIDPDAFFAKLIKSPKTSNSWGLDAREHTVAEFLILTTKGDVYKLDILSLALRQKQSVSAVLLYGKGFSCRFDYRQSPPGGDTKD